MEHWEESEMENGTVVTAMRRVFNKDKRGFSVDKVGRAGEVGASELSTNH